MTEQWRPVVGHEGLYEVSDQGRVRTVARWHRTGATPRLLPVKTLAQAIGGRAENYKRVMLRAPTRHAYVHHLVLEAFVGPRPPDMQVCHINDDGFDNRLANLYYGSRDDNEIDRWMAKRVGTPEHAELEDAPF